VTNTGTEGIGPRSAALPVARCAASTTRLPVICATNGPPNSITDCAYALATNSAPAVTSSTSAAPGGGDVVSLTNAQEHDLFPKRATSDIIETSALHSPADHQILRLLFMNNHVH
jgi:hypothetical protein